MSGRILAALSLIALLALAGCGGGGGTSYGDTTSAETTATTQTTETTPPETTILRVYMLLDGKVQPVSRELPKTEAVARAALEQLLAGPSTANRELGLESALPAGVEIERVVIEDGKARVRVSKHLAGDAMAQVVYTLTQFPTVRRGVEVEMPDGTVLVDREDFETYTPQILVESPLPYETVSSPIHATGTANTFEATFQYEVVGPDGTILDKNFVTATSGTGQRGTFDFTTKPFDATGDGALVVFEYSAKDGSRIHEVRIPVQLTG